MNTKCEINIKKLNNKHVKHVVTYELLFYIASRYDTETDRFFMDKQALIIDLGTSYKTLKDSINELLEIEAIIKCESYRSHYKLNKQFINVL